ncbi:hypothetical protein Tco_1346522 [Tanacetum coccineum]
MDKDERTPSNRDSADVSLVADVKTVVDGNDDDDVEFEIETLTVAHSDDDENDGKILRSGSGSGKSKVDLGSVVVDDDIEDFWSPEDNNAKAKTDCLFW